MNNEQMLLEVKNDLLHFRRWSENLERRLERLFEDYYNTHIDLYKMTKMLSSIQQHEDCTEEMFLMIEELKDNGKF